MGSLIGFQMKGMIVAAAVVFIIISASGKWVAAQPPVHHVVGGDRGWDPTSDLLSWSSARMFRVGDHIWFTYSVAQGLIAELKSREEYESCDLSNPIKMYTEGLHTISLEREGIRYFVSTESENCKNGLKLHLDILPKAAPITNSFTPILEAAAPTAPSSSARFNHNTIIMLILMLCLTIGLAY